MAILWNSGHETFTDYSTKPYSTVAKPTYAGAVLGTRGADVRVMSDVWAWLTYASVWDGTKVSDVTIACSDPHAVYGTATVDATPEVLAAVAVWRAAEAMKAEAAEAARVLERRMAEAARVAKGKDVTVVRGRKVAKGTTGRVFWMGAGKWGTRVGLTDAAGTVHWTAAYNVEVTNPDAYLAA